MNNTAILDLWASILLIIFKCLGYILRKRRQAIKSRGLGCEPIPAYTLGDPLGIYSLFETIRAAKNNYLSEYMVDRIKIVRKKMRRGQ